MKERPILFSGTMVRALLSGTKTQTRRTVKPQPTEAMWDIARANLGGDTYKARPAVGIGGIGLTVQRGEFNPIGFVEPNIRCPFGRVGDALWVREKFHTCPHCPENFVAFGAGGFKQSAVGVTAANHTCMERLKPACEMHGWKPSIYMPRWASRITLEITGVRVERLQEISEADAIAEGVVGHEDIQPASAYYRELWESINGPGSWDANPWVWVIEFKRVERVA